MSKDQLTEMLAIQWKYSKGVNERTYDGMVHLRFLADIEGKFIVTGELKLECGLWWEIKPKVIEKASSLKY